MDAPLRGLKAHVNVDTERANLPEGSENLCFTMEVFAQNVHVWKNAGM